jgi:hypothetical protein
MISPSPVRLMILPLYVSTTDSDHDQPIYPNRAKGMDDQWAEPALGRGHNYVAIVDGFAYVAEISTSSQSMGMTIQTREKLHELPLGLIRSVFPPPKGIRLVGVMVSNFQAQSGGEAAELPLS